LLAGKANLDGRVVARLSNDVLRAAMADDNGPGAILNVAELAAPSVVKACLAHATHLFEAAGIPFVVSGTGVSQDATLYKPFGGLDPVASDPRRKLLQPWRTGDLPTSEPGPRRDAHLRADDTVFLVGPYRELLDTLRKSQSPPESRADVGDLGTGQVADADSNAKTA
jgi:hypothetical protein